MIEIQQIKQRDEKRQIAYIKVDGTEFSVGNVPIEFSTDTQILNWLNKNEKYYKFLILQKQYPEADWQRFQKEGMSNYEAIIAWIKAGHKNLIGKDDRKNIYKVIEKQELGYRHPKSIELMAKIEGANITPELKSLLKEIVK